MNKVFAAQNEGAEYGETPIYSDESSNLVETAQNIPLQIPQIQNIKDEIKKDLQAEMQTQIQTANSSLDNVTGYLAIGALAISVISILLLIIIKSSLQSRMNKLTTLFNMQRDELSKVTDELKVTKNEINRLKNHIENLEMKLSKVEEIPERQPQSYVSPPIQLKKTPPEDKFKDFISDFNALKGVRGSEQIKLREEFLSKYKIKGFNCKNFNERMNNPSLEPEFETSQSPASCEYWAYEDSNETFVVLPNVKSYNENYHVARAMSFVFDSNFENGNYSNIRVIKPAIFRSNLQLFEKGELVLSK